MIVDFCLEGRFFLHSDGIHSPGILHEPCDVFTQGILFLFIPDCVGFSCARADHFILPGLTHRTSFAVFPRN